MKLLWLTDLHLRAPTEPGHADADRRVSAVLEHALAHHADADRLIVSGDIANDGTEAQYSHFRAFNVNHLLPTRLLAGNHDNPDTVRALNSENGWAGAGFSEEVVEPYQLFYLDSHAPGRDLGHIGPEQLAWLDRRLAEARHPALIFLHHQPGPVFLPGADTIGLDDQEALEAVLVCHQAIVRHIFFGHCHRPVSGSVAGIAMTGLPAVSTQMAANFSTAEFIPDPDTPPCYGVIIGNGTNLACHAISLPEWS